MQFENLKTEIINKLEEELSDDLHYHSVDHTKDVMKACRASIKRHALSDEESILLLTAALLHDSGFLNTTLNHEEEGVRIAKKILPSYGYSRDQIGRISNMILATKIPQQPNNILEELICDADLDYLGRDDFYTIGATLYSELKARNILSTEEEWDKLQISFLSSHTFHSSWSISEREPIKQKYLGELQEKWGRDKK